MEIRLVLIYPKLQIFRILFDSEQFNPSQTGFSDFEELQFDFTNYRKQTTRGISRDKSEFLKLLRDVHVTNSPRSMYKAIRNSRLMSYDEHKAIVNEIQTEENKDIRWVSFI